MITEKLINKEKNFKKKNKKIELYAIEKHEFEIFFLADENYSDFFFIISDTEVVSSSVHFYLFGEFS
jgi:hypothetical protein